MGMVWLGPLCQATSLLGSWPHAPTHPWRILVTLWVLKAYGVVPLTPSRYTFAIDG